MRRLCCASAGGSSACVRPAASENEEGEEKAENDGHQNADAGDRRVGLTLLGRHRHVHHVVVFYGRRWGYVNQIGMLTVENA